MEDNNGNGTERLERQLKMLTILVICTLAVSAASLVFQFVPFPGRMMGGADFRTSGQFPPSSAQGQDGGQGQGGPVQLG